MYTLFYYNINQIPIVWSVEVIYLYVICPQYFFDEFNLIKLLNVLSSTH